MNWLLAALIASIIVEIIREHEKLTIKFDKANKKIIFATGAIGAYIVIALLSGASFFAYKDNKANGDKIDSLTYRTMYLDTTVFFLKDTIQNLRTENIIEQQRHESNLVKAGKDNTEDIKLAYAAGIERGERNTVNIIKNDNENAQKLKQGIDSNKLKPAYIEMLREPHNVFVIDIKDNKFKGIVTIENSGDMVAYSVRDDVYLLIKINGILFKLNTPNSDEHHNISGGTRRPTEISALIPKELLEAATDFYCILIGSYYTDPQLKNNIKYKLATQVRKNERENLPVYDVDSLLKTAIPFIK